MRRVGPLNFNVETAIFTDLAIYNQNKRTLNSNDEKYVVSQMRIFYSHFLHGVSLSQYFFKKSMVCSKIKKALYVFKIPPA